MSAEVILGVFFAFILITFVAGLFLFPNVFGISKQLNHDDNEQQTKK
jgi:Ca2+/Na+ antiporter